MKTTLNLDDELLRKAKRQAAARGTTLTAVVEEGLRTVTSTPPEPVRFELSLPIVRGDGLPRVDPADRSALYDVMDGR